jgi:proline racemase
LFSTYGGSHAKGDLKKGDRMIGRSILDSRFDCQIVEEVLIGNQIAIIPSIRGRAWITGTHQLDLDDEDPFPNGYRLSDTWPSKVVSIFLRLIFEIV